MTTQEWVDEEIATLTENMDPGDLITILSIILDDQQDRGLTPSLQDFVASSLVQEIIGATQSNSDGVDEIIVQCLILLQISVDDDEDED